MYSCSKSQAHPSFRWISWIMCLVSYLSHSWGNFKFFSLSFLRYFGLIISFIWLISYFIFFFFCVITVILLSYTSHIFNTLVGNWGHMIFPSLSVLFPWYVPTIKKSFTLTIIKAREKNAQNTNSFLDLQGQEEYYLVGPNVILMALYSINSLSPPFESWLHRTSVLPHKQCI